MRGKKSGSLWIRWGGKGERFSLREGPRDDAIAIVITIRVRTGLDAFCGNKRGYQSGKKWAVNTVK